MAIMCLMENLVKGLENGEVWIWIFIDFRKAFDTVDHNILLAKLQFYGIRSMAHNWFSSYLTEKTNLLNSIRQVQFHLKFSVVFPKDPI